MNPSDGNLAHSPASRHHRVWKRRIGRYEEGASDEALTPSPNVVYLPSLPIDTGSGGGCEVDGEVSTPGADVKDSPLVPMESEVDGGYEDDGKGRRDKFSWES